MTEEEFKNLSIGTIFKINSTAFGNRPDEIYTSVSMKDTPFTFNDFVYFKCGDYDYNGYHYSMCDIVSYNTKKLEEYM